MNILSEIKALFTVKDFVQDTVKEAKRMDGVKPGYKTTEFWLTVLTNLIALVGALKGVIPDQTATIVVAAINGVYGVVRAITKQGNAAAPVSS